MDCESGSSAENFDETDYESDEEALGKISQKPIKIVKSFKAFKKPSKMFGVFHNLISLYGLNYG